ncbi:MAG TPA: hypothetical protein PK253_06910 [Spirochaetota bacterium]|nr:hypothetical protein [Spirochaetota bacterium]
MKREMIIAAYLAGLLFFGGCGSDATGFWHGSWVAGDGQRAAVIELKKENGMYLMSIGGTEPGGFTYDTESGIFYTMIGREKYTVTFKDGDTLRFESPGSYIDFRRK